jgi:hypothetical protein
MVIWDGPNVLVVDHEAVAQWFYQGVVEGYKWIDIDEDLYVLDVTTSRSASGERKATLTVSTASDRRTADSDLMIEVVRDIRALKVNVQPSLARPAFGPYVKTVSAGGTTTTGTRFPVVSAEFDVTLGNETLDLLYAKLRFVSSKRVDGLVQHQHKLLDVAQSGTSGGTTHKYQALNSVAGSSYDFLWLNGPSSSPASLYSHYPISFNNAWTDGLFYSRYFPLFIRLEINGDDVTTALGGPWGSGSVAADVEVDITSLLTGASGGLRQRHTFVFTCDGYYGDIQFEVQALAVVQAIAVT